MNALLGRRCPQSAEAQYGSQVSRIAKNGTSATSSTMQ
jgi:hypothetical protein